MINSAKYIKIVEWSDEDQCFVGHCPGIIGLVVTAMTRWKYFGSFVRSSMNGWRSLLARTGRFRLPRQEGYYGVTARSWLTERSAALRGRVGAAVRLIAMTLGS